MLSGVAVISFTHWVKEMSLMTNSKIFPMWVKSSNFCKKLMKYWLKQPIFTSNVGLFKKCPSLTDPVTWNPGYTQKLHGAITKNGAGLSRPTRVILSHRFVF